MLKNLLNSFKALTLVAVSMVSGGALQAQDYTLDVEITGEGSAKMLYYDYSSGGERIVTLETKVYEFPSEVVNGAPFVISSVEGELESIEINGELDETALSTLKGGKPYSFSFPTTNQGSLKLVFEGGEEPSEPEVPEEYDMAINLTVEGGEAEVSYWYYKADPLDEKQEGVLAAGMNYLDNMWNSTSNHYHIYLAATAADGYAVKEVYVDEHPTDYSSDNIFIQRDDKGAVVNVRVVCEETLPEGYHTITLKSTGIEGLTYFINVPNEEMTQTVAHFSGDEDVVVPIHDGGYFTWNYSASLDYTVRGLLVDGKPLEEVSDDGQTYVVTSDVVLSLDYLPTDYCEFSCVEPEGGNIIIEYQEYDINIYDYVWLPLEEGMPVVTGTEYRATFETDEDYALTAVYVDGEKVFEADAADEEYEYTYKGVAWASVELKMETVALASVGELSSEPVKMDVYSIDGVLVRSCVAETVDEAVSGLAQGLYIVNGQKVVVR
jgi:hypothetical protein